MSKNIGKKGCTTKNMEKFIAWGPKERGGGKHGMSRSKLNEHMR